MEKIDMINNFIKTFFLCIYIFIVYTKIWNYENDKVSVRFICILYSFFMAVVYTFAINYFDSVILFSIILFIYSAIISIITKSKLVNCIISIMISFVIVYTIYVFSIIFAGILIYTLKININKYNPLVNVFILPIEIILIFLLFKVKRLKKGLYFLKNPNDVNEIYKYIIVFGCIVLLICGGLKSSRDMLINTCLLTGTIAIFIRFILWAKSQITKSYKNKMRDRTIEIQKTESDEKTKIIEEIKAENLKLATAIHKYNHKFSALEHAMKNAVSANYKTEFAKEISVILNETKETLQNFSKEVEITKHKLPLTDIAGIDNMFKYMQDEAIKNNINFDLKINENINTLINNIISQEKFEILIGDHLKDAIIAVNASNFSYRSILVTLGLVEGHYEFSIYDTGIEFEIDTLLKLGKEQITTHAQEGGSGIGFMTTFETLKQCKASIVIEEYNPETTNYTKSVTIKFDGRNEYKICSYRAEKIKEQKPERRIIIEKLK